MFGINIDMHEIEQPQKKRRAKGRQMVESPDGLAGADG
jgi:hypothetical protein